MEVLMQVLNRIERLDPVAMRAMQMSLNELTKPVGSLGYLEQMAVKLAGIQSTPQPLTNRKAVVVMCADHGVTEEGVSAYPSAVTGLMIGNFAKGKAAINVLAQQQGARVRVVDIGSLLAEAPAGVEMRKVRSGTANMARGPAMTRREAVEAIRIGIQTAQSLADEGVHLIGLGGIGIGNTTASSAMTAVFTGRSVRELTGYGTGISAGGLAAKAEVPDAGDPLDVLAKVGGLEIAGLAGVILGAASRRMAVVVDGVITGAAALAAYRLEPRCRDFMFASHLSEEPAHRIILEELGLKPVLHLGMRLGEGTGVVLAFPLFDAAVRVADRMATFPDLEIPSPAPSMEEYSLYPAALAPAGGPKDRLPRYADKTEPGQVQMHAFSPAEKAAVYKAIEQRRDIRSFRPDPVPEELIMRLLRAAHHAPSVGFMQPWNFIVVRSPETKQKLHQAADKERRALSIHYEGEMADRFAKLKIEAITDAPVTLCVTLDPTRGGLHVLGRNSIPETDLASVACAIQNLWLAARAEGLAAGWVSFYKKQEVRQILNIPPHIDPVALISIGYTDEFPDKPLLEKANWRRRLPLEELVYSERWNAK